MSVLDIRQIRSYIDGDVSLADCYRSAIIRMEGEHLSFSEIKDKVNKEIEQYKTFDELTKYN